MTSARYDAAAHWRRRGFLADDWVRNCGLIVGPPRRRPVVLYMCIGWSTAARRIGTLRTLTRLNDRPCDRWAVLKTGLPDVERGTTGVVNRQPVLLTAAGWHWQGASAPGAAGGA